MPNNTNQRKSPKLRTVNKAKPPYPLNQFPYDFGFTLGRELIYLLATKTKPSIKGEEWEEIFANCIHATWKPSNVGLDDVVLGNCAWGAKTIKATGDPANKKTVRLISGRNSPIYSFGDSQISEVDADGLGLKVLDIWNERVSGIRQIYKFCRTIILIKSFSLYKFGAFEFDTIRYEPDLFYWSWNKNNNLEGFEKRSDDKRFVWQPHGSQFTIIEKVPDNLMTVQIKEPPESDKEKYLDSIGFDESWITVLRKNK